MTEAEWVACEDPTPMLEFLRGRVSNRKLRLMAVACCRLVWDELTPATQAAVAAAELYADRALSRRGMRSAQRAAYEEFCVSEGGWGAKHAAGYFAADWNNWEAVTGAARCARLLYPKPPAYLRVRAAARPTREMLDASIKACAELKRGVARLQADTLRCCCRPFRRATARAAWLTSTVVSLAESVYAGRTYHHLPALADALENSGCVDELVLGHCRAGGPHVRGCWVIDLLLGKA